MKRREYPANPAVRRPSFGSGLSLLFVLLAAYVSYFLLRYGGRWAETDTAVLTRLIRAVHVEGTLTPETGTYFQGYAYPAFSTFVTQIGGVGVSQYQLLLAPILAVWVLLPAWLAYREFAKRGTAATLATMVLLIQPEFIFVIMRSSHEKFTRGLMFLALFVLVRSLRQRLTVLGLLGSVIAFYLLIYGVISSNNLVAYSFISAIALALLAHWLLGRRSSDRSKTAPSERKLLYVLLVSLGLAFLFTFYLYEPARRNLLLIDSAWNRLAAMFLDVETQDTLVSPYQAVSTGWITPQIYLYVSAANWLVLGISGAIWLRETWRIIVRGEARNDEGATLLWAFYGAFAFLSALSIVLDLSNAIGGTNLQVRSFPSFGMFAAPVIAGWLVHQADKERSGRKLLAVSVGGLVAVLALTSLFKATSEPLLSNNWIFSTQAEVHGMQWSVVNSDHNKTSTWTDFNERLNTSYELRAGATDRAASFDINVPEERTSNYLVSQVTQLRSERLGIPLPVEADSLLVYSNGDVAVFHRRPITPFQR